jgi:hypothetical protein
MASNKTPNLNLDIWAEMDYFKRAELNNNFGKLDDKIAEVLAAIAGLGNTDHLKRNFIDVIKDFGAIADGISHPLSEKYSTLTAAKAVYPHATALTDEIDWCAIQGAINFVESSAVRKIYGSIRFMINTQKIREILLPSGQYLLGNKTITLDISKSSLVGKGAVLDCRNTALAIRLKGGDDVARGSNFRPLDGIDLFGTRGTGNVGILLKGDTLQTAVQWIDCPNVNIQQFGTGIKFEENSHQIQFSSLTITRCDTCFHVADGTNAGERITIVGGTLSDSTLCVLMECTSGSIKLTNVSLDYSDKYIKVTGGRVTMVGGHIENGADVGYSIEVYGNAGFIQLIGTELLPGSRTSTFFGYSDSTVNLGGITIRDCHIFGSNYMMHTLIAGTGKVVASNVIRYISDQRFVISESLNTIGNGQFGTAKGLSDFGTTTETPPTLDTTAGNFLTDNASLLFKTEGGTKAYAEANTIDYGIKPMQMVNYFARYKSLGLGTGINEFYILYFIKDQFGNTLKTGTKTFNVNSLDWALTTDGTILAPKGAAKISFRFRTARWESTSTNRFWLDEFNVNIQ